LTTTAPTAFTDQLPASRPMAATLLDVSLATPDCALLLDNVSIEIRRGQVTALLCETGPSANAVLDLFDGRVRPSHGSVQVGGHEVTQLDPQELARLTRDHIARVRLAYGIPQQLSVQQNLVVAQRQSRQPIDLALVARIAHVMRLDGRPGQRPPKGADAIQAHWAVARGLATKPTLLLLADITHGLSRVGELDLLEALQAAAGQFDVGALLATGDPITASSADRALLLKQGRVDDVTDEL
jgi:putative ABC transport system ATP-binding protein